MLHNSDNLTNAQTVEVIADEHAPDALWTPIVGPETLALLTHLRLSEPSKERLQQEAITVLSRCIPPTADSGTTTGLVIGYIQSGKTMSFTTVASLARDNDYRLIIVITGVNLNLFNQSTERLQRDLRLNERKDRKWQFFSNPRQRTNGDIRQRIANALNWNDALPGIGKQTVLITVLKNSTHLRNLISLLSGINLGGVPTLIIDDEADQASLNTQIRTRGQSTIYQRIQSLRQLLPHHTFLQYTATPQALLLISIIDTLSPSFVAVLTPGAAYTGGRTFFEGSFDLIHPIPPSEIPGVNPRPEPPRSLVEALRIFYLGIAAGLIAVPEDNRSMMIHPAREVQQHAVYTQWVRELQRSWGEIIVLPVADLDRCDLIEDFRAAHVELSSTVDDIPQFEELIPYLIHALRMTVITEVNAARRSTPQPDWRQEYAHILVGGEVLNRGYTVEGLIVTYMPRSIGMGNADTIQQRARWFGYKADYLGYCRVYLSEQVRQAYEEYVAHEEDMRRQLREFSATGKSLQEWSRVLRLSADLQPTRSNVIDRDYLRGNFSDTWYTPRVPHGSTEANQSNRVVVDDFISGLQLEQDEGHARRTEEQKHFVATGVSLDLAYSELLSRLQLSNRNEWQRYAGMLKQVSDYLEDYGDEECTVFLMSRGTLRVRSVDGSGEIPTLFQGPNPDRTGEYYPGDRQIRASEGLTIQIHNLTVRQDGNLVADNVPAIAVWVPNSMSQPWLVQDQRNR